MQKSQQPPKADVQRKDGKWDGCNLRQARVEGRLFFYLEVSGSWKIRLPPPNISSTICSTKIGLSAGVRLLFSGGRLNVPAGITGGIDGSLWIIKPVMEQGDGGGVDWQVFHLSLT